MSDANVTAEPVESQSPAPEQQPEEDSSNWRVITKGEAAGQTETSNDNMIPPGQTAHQEKDLSADAQVELLASFLKQNFPDEVGRTNVQQAETPVEIAIRLLLGLSAHGSATDGRRCAEAFCNKPLGHSDAHGWIHYQ